MKALFRVNEISEELDRLRAIMLVLQSIYRTIKVIYPVYHRARGLMAQPGLSRLLDGITVTEPLQFFDMISLEKAAAAAVTDSGGVQKEAFFSPRPLHHQA